MIIDGWVSIRSSGSRCPITTMPAPPPLLLRPPLPLTLTSFSGLFLHARRTAYFLLIYDAFWRRSCPKAGSARAKQPDQMNRSLPLAALVLVSYRASALAFSAFLLPERARLQPEQRPQRSPRPTATVEPRSRV